MKQFNLEEYLANPSRKVVTRDGRKVRIICTDMNYKNHPIVALIAHYNDTENVYTYTKDGEFEVDYSSRHDLFFAPEKHEGWVNLYKEIIYDTKAEAEDSLSPEGCYLTTIKIEWDE